MRLTQDPSGRRGSNPRPEPWQGSALPAALRPHFPAGVPAGVNLAQAGPLRQSDAFPA